MAPTQLSIVLERLLNELGIANLSMFEAVLMHDTGAVLDAIRSTAAAAEAGAAALCQLGHEQCCCVPKQHCYRWRNLCSAQGQHLPHSRQHRRANHATGFGHPCSPE